ncbi:MAG TPA: protein kinase [Bryobacteraceae bacterium]
MPVPSQIKGRYEIREVLGKGGMGVVYSAYDRVVKRGVALKTIRDTPSRTALELFYKECAVLASMSHPNIVEIFDIGEFEEDGTSRPYFVMPLLPGKTLESFIQAGSNRLTVERCVEIFAQTCRGLQAAHDRGLIHRDLKPSNIFVLEDDSVKIIDFGVAHMTDSKTTMGHKGTLLYMSPEQIEMKPASALSDIFSLGVVCFEALTLRHPFERGTASGVPQAILKFVPPPVSELNPTVNAMLSRVVHKAIAKQPWYRFASAREMGEALQKAGRNEALEIFDASHIQPRVERAQKAFEGGDSQFADEILSELEAEGQVDSSVSALRRQIDHARRQKTIGQLLESAKTRAEQEEYPLALQKLQELLELDPENGTALALKNSIATRRSERKIDDWFRLARQHMDQNAFGHARQALHSVLELKPGDTRAVQLVAEVERREQEFLRARQEKEELYAKALDAWQGGEVSVALSKLERLVDIDRRTADSGASDRSATFQSFYNKVRSEHETTKNAYEQARKNLNDGNYDAALALCNEQLEKRPGQALFQALKLDVEEGQRQRMSSQIAETDRQVEAEPDLDRRVSLLAEALERNPGEAHFERALRTMRDKRDLVNSIVSRARAQEERGQFGEALAQWEILKSIYFRYPGLDFEIERTRRRRDQQLRAEAKMKWVEQIDWQLAAGDAARARDLLRDATAEFPGDPELEELRQLAMQGLARADEAQKLLQSGQQLCKSGQFDEGIETLRRAYDMDGKNVAIRAALTGALVEAAKRNLDDHWQTAEQLAEQALELDPSNAQAKSLRTLALDRKRDEFVDRAVAQARRLQTSGQFEEALKEVEAALAEYPGEPRLTQLRSTLTKAHAETQDFRATHSMAGQTKTVIEPRKPEPPRVPRNAATETLYIPPSDSETIVMRPAAAAQESAPPKAAAPSVPAAPSEPARTAPPEMKVEPPAATVQPPVAAPVAQAAPPPAAPVAQQTAPPAAPPATPPASSGTAAPPKPPPAAPAKASPAAPAKSGGKGKDAKSKTVPQPAPVQAAAAGTPPAGAKPADKTPPAKPEPAKTTAPPPVAPAAGKSKKTLIAAGVACAVLAVGAIVAIPKMRKAPPPQPVAANPVPSPIPNAGPVHGTLRVFADLEHGKVTLDDKEVGELQDSQLTLDNIAPGPHTVKITGQFEQATLTIQAADGSAPNVESLTAKEVVAIAVATTGTRTKVQSSAAPAKVSIDGKPAGEAGPNGLEVADLAQGNHELAIGEGASLRSMVVSVGSAPTLTVFLKSDRNVGTLVLVTGEDGARVFLDGKEYRRKTQKGQVRIANLASKEYAVRVAKDGFQDAPEQRVTIRKGEELKLELKLTPVPKMASLALAGALPGAQVLLDGASIGTVQDDGVFTASSVTPGEHAVELRKDSYKPKKIEKRFEAGATVEVAAAELAMERVPGTVRFKLTPPDARVTIAKTGESPKPATDNMTVPEGSYTITAHAPGFTDRSVTFTLSAGETKTVEMALAAAKVAAKSLGMADWDDAAAWTQESGWYVRKGGNFVGYKAAPTAGTFVFTADLRKGKRLEWVLARKDAKNYILFQMDKKFFYRTIVVDGKETQLTKAPYSAPKGGALTIEVDVTADGVVNKLYDGTWVVLDAWSEAARQFDKGKFGFQIPGGDVVALSNFSFTPK